jgi:hypothetical protein
MSPIDRTTRADAARAWPERHALCLDCRTALSSTSDPCPGGRSHRVRSLVAPAGRDALLTEVWGPLALRRRIAESARVSAVSGGGTAMLEGCGGLAECALTDGLGLAVAAAVAAAAFILWLGVSLVRALVRAWRRRPPPPRGARSGPVGPGPQTGRVGRIEAKAGERLDPIGGRRCVGFAVELRHRPGLFARGRAMLRDAVSGGFDVVLDSGERVRIPPGPLLLDARTVGVDAHPRRLADYLAALDPARGSTDDLDPFPHSVVGQALLTAGQLVEVRGRLIPTADPAAAPSTYRDPAGALLVPDGVPRLAILRL